MGSYPKMPRAPSLLQHYFSSLALPAQSNGPTPLLHSENLRSSRATHTQSLPG